MSLLDTLGEWLGKAEAEPTHRQMADMLGGGSQIEDDPFPQRVDGRPFDAGECYFGVRLAGLHLVNARLFTTAQLPLCVCLAEFDHAGQRRSIPFAIGPDVIQRKLSEAGVDTKAGPAWVELRNITVVRPTPVSGGEVSLFAGLFSLPGDDLIKQLLNVVGAVGTALAQPAVGAGLKVADAVYGSFSSLLSFNKVQQVAAGLIGQLLTDAGSGYLLIANTSDVDQMRKARVVNGRLHWPQASPRKGAEVTEFDHALLAVERYDTVVQKDNLAPALFQTQWLEALKGGGETEARAGLARLMDAVTASPDLTETDRVALLTGYALAFDRIAAARWPQTATLKTRGAGDGEREGLADRLTVLSSAAAVRSATPQVAAALKGLTVLAVQRKGLAASNEAAQAEAGIDEAILVRETLGKHGAVSAPLVDLVVSGVRAI